MQQGDPAWHDLRSRHAITWSNAADALGIGYNSRQKFMRIKLGMQEADPPNWKMMEGTKREPWAAELYYRVMGAFGQPIRFYTDVFKTDPQDHRLGGSLDRIVEDVKTGDRWLLEIKTCPDGDMRTEIPTAHLCQMHGLCHTHGFDKANYFCWSQVS